MNHKARKRFGQNFLQDNSVIDRILHSLRLQPDDNVVEVGPGLGALTFPLLEQLNRLDVIEIDRDLIARLENQQPAGLHIHSMDALTVDFSQFNTRGPLRVVGNLPYNIGTPLLLQLLKHHRHLQDIHVMLQKEVVDRLHAHSGTRAFGRLSVLMQSVFSIEPLFTVPPDAFSPPPKIQSAVVRLRPRADAPDDDFIAALEQCTRIAFANKRKTLRNNFKGHLDDAALNAIGINPQNRAETLSLEDFHRLAKHLSLS